MRSIAIHVFSPVAMPLARRLGRELSGMLFAPARIAGDDSTPFNSLGEHMQAVFARFDAHVFLGAAGIAVRAIAPHVASKLSDPAVVVMDIHGRNAVSLLSGHLGGANDLAVRCAEISGGRAVVTTGTDVAEVPSMDVLAQEQGLVMSNPEAVKHVNAALVEGRMVQVFDPRGFLGLEPGENIRFIAGRKDYSLEHACVWVSWKSDAPENETVLKLHPQVLCVGMGCRKGVPEPVLRELLEQTFESNGLAVRSICALGSAELKREEAGLLQLAQSLGVAPEFFAETDLDAVQVPNPSNMVRERVGTSGVSEAAALLLSGGGELLVPKTKNNQATIAVAGRFI